MKQRRALYQFFFGGLLPVVAFTVIEEKYGPLWGTIAGMTFGCGEIIYEYIKDRKISRVTWIANGLILALGTLSIYTQDGIWFKLQPALFEAFFAFFLWTSWIIKKPLLPALALKQNPNIPPLALEFMTALTFRLGFFFAIHAVLATWAALYWSTSAWAFLKGIGVTVSFLLYLATEFLVLRYQVKKKGQSS